MILLLKMNAVNTFRRILLLKELDHKSVWSFVGIEIEWPEFEKEKRQTMILKKRSEVVADPDSHIREIWKNRRA